MDADACADEVRVKRTAKSCGPDAAVLASNSQEQVSADDGGKRAVHRGEHEVSRKATAHEKYLRKNPIEINVMRLLCRHLCRDLRQRRIAVQKYIHLLGCNQS